VFVRNIYDHLQRGHPITRGLPRERKTYWGSLKTDSTAVSGLAPPPEGEDR
jgi:hypothetical protein